MRPATALALPILLFSPAAYAATSDTQLWTTLTVQVPLTERLTGSIDISPRFRSTAAGDEQILTRASLDLALNKTVSMGGGIVYADAKGPHEIRPHQQVTLTFGLLSLRTRLEERFFEGGARPAVRLREKATLRLPLDKADKLNLGVEGLYTLQSQVVGKPAAIDSVRLNAAIDHKFSNALSLSAGYMVSIAPRKGAATRISHVPQLTLVWRP